MNFAKFVARMEKVGSGDLEKMLSLDGFDQIQLDIFVREESVRLYNIKGSTIKLKIEAVGDWIDTKKYGKIKRQGVIAEIYSSSLPTAEPAMDILNKQGFTNTSYPIKEGKLI